MGQLTLTAKDSKQDKICVRTPNRIKYVFKSYRRGATENIFPFVDISGALGPGLKFYVPAKIISPP